MKDISAEAEAQMVEHLKRVAKRELRKRMQSLRDVTPQRVHDQRSAEACARVCALPEFERAHTVAGYVAMRKELDPALALAAAHERGKQVVLPRVEGDALSFHRFRPGAPLIENEWGVPEPDPRSEQVDAASIDLVLVPALALDLRGYRLGYGKGFYDRVLPRLVNAKSVALVYDYQLLVEVPNDPHDVRVDFIVSDQRTAAAERG